MVGVNHGLGEDAQVLDYFYLFFDEFFDEYSFDDFFFFFDEICLMNIL